MAGLRQAAPLGGPASLAFEEIEIPAAEALSPFLVTALRTHSLIAEQFRVLGAQVRALDTEAPLRCLGIVSCVPGEGKTTISMGLSMALAREVGARVLLVEADLRRPMAEQYLGLPHIGGLADWLAGRTSTVAIRRLGASGLSLLTAGGDISHRPELLHSLRMRQVLAAARKLFDFVILDCPPLTPIADSHFIQDLVDGVLLVVRARTASKDLLLRAVGHLKPGRLRGAVFNDHRELLSGYGAYGYGGGYDYRYPPSDPATGPRLQRATLGGAEG